MKVEAKFVRSAAGAADLPRDGVAEIAMVGRSNVGKSSLINALLGQKIARTSAAPGKTRLANIYEVDARSRFYLVDLPGYGYAKGRSSAEEFEALTAAYFQQGRRRVGQMDRVGKSGMLLPAPPIQPAPSALLLVDARHPGLLSDLKAWTWLKDMAALGAVGGTNVVATKIDKLARGERIRAMRELESAHEDSVLPVSAVTGEGLDELWNLIDRLAKTSSRPPKPAAPTNPTATIAAGKKPPTRGPKRSSA